MLTVKWQITHFTESGRKSCGSFSGSKRELEDHLKSLASEDHEVPPTEIKMCWNSEGTSLTCRTNVVDGTWFEAVSDVPKEQCE